MKLLDDLHAMNKEKPAWYTYVSYRRQSVYVQAKIPALLLALSAVC